MELLPLSRPAVGPLGLQMCPSWVGPPPFSPEFITAEPCPGRGWNQLSLAEPAPGTELSSISLTTHPLAKQSVLKGLRCALKVAVARHFSLQDPPWQGDLLFFCPDSGPPRVTGDSTCLKKWSQQNSPFSLPIAQAPRLPPRESLARSSAHASLCGAQPYLSGTVRLARLRGSYTGSGYPMWTRCPPSSHLRPLTV